LKEYQAQQATIQADRQFQLEAEKLKLEAFKAAQTSTMPANEVEEPVEQDNAALLGIMERIDMLTQAISQPITVTRDEFGNITGAV